jgi:hypothetical protein
MTIFAIIGMITVAVSVIFAIIMLWPVKPFMPDEDPRFSQKARIELTEGRRIDLEYPTR